MKNLIKVKSYYGLAKRARKVAIGVNEILEKQPNVIICSNLLSENSYNKIKNYAEKEQIKIFQISENEMFDLTQNSKILALGIIDSGLAQAVISNL